MPDGAVILHGEHAPGCMHWNGIDISRTKGAILNDDVQDLMHQWVEKRSVSSDGTAWCIHGRSHSKVKVCPRVAPM